MIFFILIIAFPVYVIVFQTKKQFIIRKLLNFHKELKKLKRQNRRENHAFIKQNTDTGGTTLIGQTANHIDVRTQDNAKHIFICGTTGSGKTVALSNYIKSGIDKNYPMLILDGKGDVGADSILDIVHKLNTIRKIYIVDLNHPARSGKYNPFYNASPTICKDMLINMTEWSEEHYKLNTERYLQRLVILLNFAGINLSFKNIVRNMPVTEFLRLSSQLSKEKIITKDDHLENVGIANTSGKIAENAVARFSIIAESELGQIFSDDGIDIYIALKQNAVILFILNPLIYPETSPLIGRLILIDSKKAISKLFDDTISRTFFILDEINVYASPTLTDLIIKSRSANITCILSAQSLSDLDYVGGEAFKEQIIENCNNYLVLRQNSSVNAGRLGLIY